MFERLYRSLVVAMLAGGAMSAHAATGIDMARGELLYNTHCIACHTEQVHWRDQRLAKDWPSLIHQVDRWQDNTRLNWDARDIEAVSAYLNALFYHFPLANKGSTISRSGQPR